MAYYAIVSDAVQDVENVRVSVDLRHEEGAVDPIVRSYGFLVPCHANTPNAAAMNADFQELVIEPMKKIVDRANKLEPFMAAIRSAVIGNRYPAA